MLKKLLPTLFVACLSSSALAQISEQQAADLCNYAKIDRSALNDALAQAVYQQKIIDAITKPSEGKPWWQYRKIFITVSRIRAGLDFWLRNEQALKVAEKTYGVPPEIVCAIIGVETFYGRNMGSWKALDALYTLGFNYPKRESYFSKEFARFIALASREGWSYDEIRGSYAGAMGMGQFMPSAYLDYAVDFDNDGHINLFTDETDAIGSVANYFLGHGWKKGGGIYYPAHVHGADVKSLMDLQWNLTPEILYKAGVTTKVDLTLNQSIRLFAYDLEDGSIGYSVGLNNFQTIMRYNTSPLYARAVYELSEFIRLEYIKYKRSSGIFIQPEGRQP